MLAPPRAFPYEEGRARPLATSVSGRLTAAGFNLLLAGGVRGVEIGSLMAGRDPVTGANRHPPLELVRLAVPRRVYTSRQLEHAADATGAVLAEADAVRGRRITYEAPVLRHFTARFERA
jgi:tryptophanase